MGGNHRCMLAVWVLNMSKLSLNEKRCTMQHTLFKEPRNHGLLQIRTYSTFEPRGRANHTSLHWQIAMLADAVSLKKLKKGHSKTHDATGGEGSEKYLYNQNNT